MPVNAISHFTDEFCHVSLIHTDGVLVSPRTACTFLQTKHYRGAEHMCNLFMNVTITEIKPA